MSRGSRAANGVLSRQESEAIADRITSLVSAPAVQVEIVSGFRASTSFARGDSHVASEVASESATIHVDFDGRYAQVSTTRLDDTGVRALVAEAEALARANRSPRRQPLLPAQPYPDGPQIHFDSVLAAMAPEIQAGIFDRAMDAADAAGLMAAGNLSLSTSSRYAFNSRGLNAYERRTYGGFSMTSRTPDGTGSGWAWEGFEDWARVKPEAVITRSVALARRSAEPVAVEPGRYTVILEPNAVADLVEPIIRQWPARWADLGWTVFSKDPLGTNKLGLQMMDSRLRIVSDPWDPERPASTIGSSWAPIPRPVTWFENGVLRNLEYDPIYAREQDQEVVVDPGGARLSADGPTQSLEEMIASTRRGIWVNRLSHVTDMNRRTLLLSGTTRDGTFLIENGRITRAIKNFRFTESPFYVFNRLDAWGEPVRASRAVVVPRMKLRDFNFTSLTDAI